MMEFIKLARRRGVVADLIHVIFNVIFAGAAIYLTIAFESLWPAVVLVILSKWRVLAVRPRYWRANFLSSLPDLIFGIGLVTMSVSVIWWRARLCRCRLWLCRYRWG